VVSQILVDGSGGSDAAAIAGSLIDPELFAIVFDRHAGAVFRFLIRRVGRDTADELLSETFRIAFERRAGFDSERRSARPWLYGIATNLVAKHRRTEARRLRATTRLASRPPGESLAEGVVARVDARAAWPAVMHAIAGLPHGERDALLLFVWEELSYEEIAFALEVPVGTVRSRLNRARRRLQSSREQRMNKSTSVEAGTAP
jgi:RNA polymerase sigma-70 factor (ECF subfamily)